MSTLLQDVRYGVRLLARSPALTLVAVASLALGIGANTTIFTLVHAILLHPLPLDEPSRLVTIATAEVQNGVVTPVPAVSRLDFEDLRDRSDVFSGMTAAGFMPIAISDHGDPQQVFGQIVSGNYFQVLRPRFAAGRPFGPDEDRQPGEHPVVVLSYGLWQQGFGGRTDLVGQAVTLNGRRFTVVGVTSKGFRGTQKMGGAELWVPMAMHRKILSGSALDSYHSRRGLGYQAIGRLKDGVTLEHASAQMATIGRGLEETYPADNRGRTFVAHALTDTTFTGGFRERVVMASTILMAVVALVLLIACANVANLLLARAAARRQEIAVRLSLGASRARLLRQLLTESLLLSGLGGAAGLLVALWSRSLLWIYRPPFLEAGALDLNVDHRVLLFTGLVSLATGIAFGLAPAWRASRPDLVTELKERTAIAGVSRWYQARNVLVVAQVALSFVALAGAGLFLRSLASAQQIDPGFDGWRLVMLSINAGTQGYDEARGRALLRRALERLATIPGVESATISSGVPLFGGVITRTMFRDGQDLTDPRNGRLTSVNHVGADYFSTLGIPVLRGRAFTADDRPDSTPVAIVNDAMARRVWPNEDPLGRHIRLVGDPVPREVVGIARTIKYASLGEEEQTHLYLPFEQTYAARMTVQAKVIGEPSAVLATVRREIQALEPTLPLLSVGTFADLYASALWMPRMGASLLAIFAGLALLLGAMGLYGVMAYSVSQRTRELGIRLALGARPQDVRAMVVRQGVFLTASGVGIGLVLAFGLSGLVEQFLYGIAAQDPVTFVVIPILLLLVALAATYLPAWRASRINPAEALRV